MSVGPPPPPPPPSQAHDPAGAERRRKLGWVLIGAAVVVVATLFMPWIAADPAATDAAVPKELSGYEWDVSGFAAALAIGLGVYGWQGVARDTVRFHVAALIAVVLLLFLAFFGVATADSGVVERLGAGQGAATDDNAFANADAVELRYGATVAALAGVAATVAFAGLWQDARRRRKRLELAQAAARAAGR